MSYTRYELVHCLLKGEIAYLAKSFKSVLIFSVGDKSCQDVPDFVAVRGRCSLPTCAQTNSVKAPMNCGVALTPSLRVSSSTILPIENHRADLRRCVGTLADPTRYKRRECYTSSNKA